MRPPRRRPSLPARVGLTLQHAGVAITVTSATDVMAFGVGALTVLPALRAFCIFAAAGVLAIYFFQVYRQGNTFIYIYRWLLFIPCSEYD